MLFSQLKFFKNYYSQGNTGNSNMIKSYTICHKKTKLQPQIRMIHFVRFFSIVFQFFLGGKQKYFFYCPISQFPVEQNRKWHLIFNFNFILLQYAVNNNNVQSATLDWKTLTTILPILTDFQYSPYLPQFESANFRIIIWLSKNCLALQQENYIAILLTR